MCQQVEGERRSSTRPSAIQQHADTAKIHIEGLSVSWRNLNVVFNGTQALHNESGDVAAGTLVAVMGPSGGGKTTLLNALSRRGPICGGQVRYGKGLWSKALKRKVALVEQDDFLFPMLTVREQIRYSAKLRLPSLTAEQCEARVLALLETLRLFKCADTVVGDSAAVVRRGVSGGERKRLSIALQLLTLPALLFCDEPTSGLDSSTTLSVVEALRDLAHITGITAVCSIHQPSSQVFGLFDQLILINKGETLFHGPTLSATACFARIGLPAPPQFGHAEWLIDVLVMDRLSATQYDQLRSEYGPAGFDAFGQLKAATGSETVTLHDEQLGWGKQVAVLFGRCWKISSGSIWSTELALLNFGIGLLEGLLFARIGHGEQDAFSRFTASFAIVVKQMFFPMLHSLPIIPTAETLLRKDLAVGAYALSSWFLPATTIALLPDVILAAVNLIPLYWISGIADDAAAFFLTCLGVLLTIFCFQSIGLVISIAGGPRAPSLTLLCITFFFLFTGVFVPLEDVAVPWIAYVNPLYYAICFVTQAVFLQGSEYTQDESGGPPKSRDDVLDDFSLDTPLYVCVLVLLAVGLLTRLTALLLLQRKMRRELLVLQQHTEASSGGATHRAIAEAVPKQAASAEVEVV
uniref:ABC transporter domain-containing protein n=1 Tax=Calcidiscus leptoporus TaxID=127549 RepID=A0A7S0J5Y4_9EUKA|mmetsp:Transcript_40875/g.95442  ORF Transcript_40875/g.95442 Transcript_40875/m.95442 type:complete len:636 (+) Transcript_40875:70-1977(+)